MRSVMYNYHPCVRVLSYLQSYRGVLRFLQRPAMREAVNKVINVELHHIALEVHYILPISLHTLPQSEHLLQCSRYYTRALLCTLHRKGLSTASLPIREDTHVETIERTLDKHLSVLEYLFLLSEGAETGIKGEFLLM